MSNREKVIKEYEDYVNSYISLTTSYDYEFEMHKAVLAMLKEQEAVKPKSKVRHGANAQIQHFCGNCNSMLHGKPKYCSECGKGVLW